MATVRLTTCMTSFEAEVLKGHLADMGIECILQGTNFNNTYGPTPATEIVVLVDEVDLAKAQEALPQERPAREDEPEDATIVKPKAKMSLKEAVINGIAYFITFTFLKYILDLIFDSEIKSLEEYLISGCGFAIIMTLFRWLEIQYQNRNNKKV